MFDCFLFYCSSRSRLKCENDPQNTLLIIKDDDYDATVDELHNPTAEMALILTSWLNGRRLRYLILALCLPLLIPIICASFPVMCAVEVCFRLRRRTRCRSRYAPPPDKEDVEAGVQVVVELNLLERYLNDQLGLALEFVCEFDSDGDESDDFYSNRSNLLC